MRDEYIDEMINTTPKVSLKKYGRNDRFDGTIHKQKGTVLVFINSANGYASKIARPALEISLQHQNKPENIATVFATTDSAAAALAQKYFINFKITSPSFIIFRDGMWMDTLHREQIENTEPSEIASMLIKMYDKYCIQSG